METLGSGLVVVGGIMAAVVSVMVLIAAFRERAGVWERVGGGGVTSK